MHNLIKTPYKAPFLPTAHGIKAHTHVAIGGFTGI